VSYFTCKFLTSMIW